MLEVQIDGEASHPLMSRVFSQGSGTSHRMYKGKDREIVACKLILNDIELSASTANMPTAV